MNSNVTQILTRRISLKETRSAVIIETGNENCNAERSATIGLRVLLLELGNVAGDVLNGDLVLHRQPVRLTLDTGSVDEDASIGRQTGKGHHHVLIEEADFPHGTVLLQLANALLLHCQDDNVFATDAHLLVK